MQGVGDRRNLYGLRVQPSGKMPKPKWKWKLPQMSIQLHSKSKHFVQSILWAKSLLSVLLMWVFVKQQSTVFYLRQIMSSKNSCELSKSVVAVVPHRSPTLLNCFITANKYQNIQLTQRHNTVSLRKLWYRPRFSCLVIGRSWIYYRNNTL